MGPVKSKDRRSKSSKQKISVMGDEEEKKSTNEQLNFPDRLPSNMRDTSFSLFKKKGCPGCKHQLNGLVNIFKRTRKCEKCKLVHCYSCTYQMKREVEQKKSFVNQPPKLDKIILCYRCELKDNGRNESVVNTFEKTPTKDADGKMSIVTKNRLAYLSNEDQRIDHMQEEDEDQEEDSGEEQFERQAEVEKHMSMRFAAKAGGYIIDEE